MGPVIAHIHRMMAIETFLLIQGTHTLLLQMLGLLTLEVAFAQEGVKPSRPAPKAIRGCPERYAKQRASRVKPCADRLHDSGDGVRTVSITRPTSQTFMCCFCGNTYHYLQQMSEFCEAIARHD